MTKHAEIKPVKQSALLIRHLILREIQTVAERDIASRIVTVILLQFSGEPSFQIRQDLYSHQPADRGRYQFYNDESDQHTHVLRKNDDIKTLTLTRRL